MKKIGYYIFCLMFIWPATGCADLETAPPDKPSETTFWKTKADFMKALNGCYIELQSPANLATPTSLNLNGRLGPMLISYDCLTDNAHRGEGSYDYGNQIYLTGDLSPATTGHVTALYSEAFQLIARINIFIEKLENSQSTGLTDDEKRNMFGQVFFLRGYAYWMLYLFYGEVPVVTEPLTVETQVQPKKSRAEVYAHVLSDLNRSINSFTADQTYKQSEGRATKNAARGLKARVIMFNAFDTQGKAISAEIQKAYNVLDSIKGYSLNPEYAFNYYPEYQEASPEIIFSIKYLAPNSYHNMDLTFGNDNGMLPTMDLFDAYSPGDTRRLKTFAEGQTYTWIDRPTVTFPISANSNSYRRPIKGVSPLPLPSGDQIWGKSNRGDYDPIILRWGELLLLKAEAAVELGLLDEAKSAVDLIRDRGTTLAHLPFGLTQNELRDSVRHERRVETAYESGLRYYDLKRWKTMQTALHKAFDNDPNYNLVVTWTAEKNYDFPLPQSEIDKSNGLLIQNPAYK